MEKIAYRFSEFLVTLPYYTDLSGSFEEKVDKYASRILEDGKKYGFGEKSDEEQVRFIAGLKLNFGRNTVIHQIDSQADKKILTTDLQVIPEKLPSILEGPYVIEARGREALFDNVICIYGYALDKNLYIAFMQEIKTEGEEAAISSFFCIKEEEFKGRSIKKYVRWMKNETDERIVNKYGEKLYVNENGLMMKAITYLLVFGIMLKAERTPVTFDNKLTEMKTAGEGGKKIKKTWITRYIYLSKAYLQKRKEEMEDIKGELDKEGKTVEEIDVRGYLRYQACGEKWKDRKLVWVEAYLRRQWVSEGNIKYVVMDRK